MNKINLTPDPRILRMLGQIELKGWQCIAEFVDNSIDAMLKEREEDSADFNKIEVYIPSPSEVKRKVPVVIKDNGVGMDTSDLENSLRAGYTSQNIDNLGLFGMGFNISTARLGDIVEVWTSKDGMDHDIGVKINLLEMQREHSFERELLKRDKSFVKSGTSIEVSGYHPRAEKLLNRSQIQRQLNRIYAQSLLDDYRIQISINTKQIKPYQFCVWGDERYVIYKGEKISVLQNIHEEFGKRSFCQRCLIWLDKRADELADELCCSSCNSSDKIKSKNVILRGWMGIQRYNHTEEYGFNIIRNGRIIKQLNKELFTWNDRYERNNGQSIFEYPIDTTTQGGRIVGEIIADFITPTYTKDSFEETDKLWLDTVDLVRGKAPLQPEKAKDLGFGKNKSPLAKLFYGFRRSSPPGKRWLIPGTSEGKGMYEAAREWGLKFHNGDFDYQSDKVWWDHVVQAEVQDDDTGSTKPNPFSITVEEGSTTISGSKFEEEQDENDELYPGKKTHIFNKQYDLSELLNEKPISLTVMKYWPEAGSFPPIIFDGKSSTKFDVYVNQSHPLFRDFADGFEDLLLMELASKFYERTYNIDEFTVTRIYYELKKKYAGDTMLSVDNLVLSAKTLIKDIQNFLAIKRGGEQLKAIPVLTIEEQENLKRSYLQIENSSLNSIDDIISTTEYLKYMDLKHVFKFASQFPELLFDNHFFNLPFSTIDSKLIRESQLDQYNGFLNDVKWFIYELSEYSDEVVQKNKSLIVRNKYSLELLNERRS